MIDISPQLLASGLLIGGVYALLSIGLTLIFGVLRIVNFAQGEFIMLAMFGAFWLHALFAIDPFVSIFIVKPLLHAPHAMQIFATFGLSVVMQNIALTFWGPDYRSVQTSYSSQSFIVGN